MRRQRHPSGRRPRHRGPALDVVFEDGDVIVVNKPAGLLTVATATEKRRTLYEAVFTHLRAKRPPERVFIVHRLDRDASGLVVLAKRPEAKHALQRQFARHAAGRLYVAVVEGRMGLDETTIRSHLRESSALKVHSTHLPSEGRLAVTHVRGIRATSRYTLVEVRLETGRKHQIRAHLAEAGHPIVGDRRYGRAGPLGRLALHAAELAFAQPSSGKPLRFRSPAPEAFRALVRARTRPNAASFGDPSRDVPD